MGHLSEVQTDRDGLISSPMSLSICVLMIILIIIFITLIPDEQLVLLMVGRLCSHHLVGYLFCSFLRNVFALLLASASFSCRFLITLATISDFLCLISLIFYFSQDFPVPSSLPSPTYSSKTSTRSPSFQITRQVDIKLSVSL